ncbi:GntR family transcriptional regulator [Gordonia sp. NPDC003376]
MDHDKTFSTISRLADDLVGRGFAKLPAERELAERLNVSRSAVRRVLADMEALGVIRRVRGRTGGAFLTAADTRPDDTFAESAEDGVNRRVERTLDTVVGVPQMLRSQGFESGTRLLSAGFEHPSREERAYFGIGPEDLLAAIVRIRFADGDSLSLESFRVPAGRFPRLLEHSLIGSLYELLEEHYGVRAGEAHEQIQVVHAAPRVAAALAVEVDTPLLKVTRESVDHRGRPLERSIDYFRADRTVLHVTARSRDEHDHSTTMLEHRLDDSPD